jgi:hypothetical protein
LAAAVVAMVMSCMAFPPDSDHQDSGFRGAARAQTA